MNVTISDVLIKGLDLTADHARLELAIGLYTGGEITLGRGAQIASSSQAQFLRELGKRRIPVHYTVADFEADVKTIERGIGI